MSEKVESNNNVGYEFKDPTVEANINPENIIYNLRHDFYAGVRLLEKASDQVKNEVKPLMVEMINSFPLEMVGWNGRPDISDEGYIRLLKVAKNILDIRPNDIVPLEFPKKFYGVVSSYQNPHRFDEVIEFIPNEFIENYKKVFIKEAIYKLFTEGESTAGYLLEGINEYTQEPYFKDAIKDEVKLMVNRLFAWGAVAQFQSGASMDADENPGAMQEWFSKFIDKTEFKDIVESVFSTGNYYQDKDVDIEAIDIWSKFFNIKISLNERQKEELYKSMQKLIIEDSSGLGGVEGGYMLDLFDNSLRTVVKKCKHSGLSNEEIINIIKMGTEQLIKKSGTQETEHIMMTFSSKEEKESYIEMRKKEGNYEERAEKFIKENL